jgi:hypothetical protein
MKIYQKHNKSKWDTVFIFCILALPLATIFSLSLPVLGQEIQLGDDTNVDLDEDETELKPSLSTDGDRVNIQVEEQPKPETQIELNDDGVEVREEREPARERLDLSVPVDEEQN